MSVVIETTKGIFTVDLFIDERPKGKKIRNIRYFNEKLGVVSSILSDNVRFFSSYYFQCARTF